jgi:hypothetical protein
MKERAAELRGEEAGADLFGGLAMDLDGLPPAGGAGRTASSAHPLGGRR